MKGILTIKKKNEFEKRLSNVYNRGFSKGFYLGKPIDEWADSYGSKSTMVKEYIGYVRNYYSKVGVCEIKLESGSIQKNDKILIIGPTTGCVETVVNSMEINNKKIKIVKKGQSVGIKIDLVRVNDKVYKWKIRTSSENQ